MKTIKFPNPFKNTVQNWHLLIPVVLIVFYLGYFFIPDEGAYNLKYFIHENFFLHTQFHEFVFKPWTLFTFFLFHENPVLLIINLAGFFIFSSLTSNILGKKVIIPLFLIGNMTGALFLIFFAALPFSKGLSIPSITAGANGGIMALLLVSTYYIPKKIVRFYGIFPVRLKYVGMALPALCLFFLVADKFADLQLQYLGGMVSGMFFALGVRSGNVHPNNLRPVKKKRNINYQTSLWEEVENERIKAATRVDTKVNVIVQVGIESFTKPSQYLDFILEKITDEGFESLSVEEKKFLENYSKKLQ